MITLQNIVHRYHNQPVVALAYWEAKAEEQWLLRGNSGSGKTTLLHILAGLLTPTAGEVKIGNTVITTLKGTQLDTFRGQNIGIVFQQPYLIKTLNLIDNLRVAQNMAGKKIDHPHLLHLVESLHLTHLQHKYPHQLSTGEAQRVCIARALANSPQLLLADEPTAALDDQNATAVINLLKTQAAQHHTTLVVATHDSRLVAHFEKTLQL